MNYIENPLGVIDELFFSYSQSHSDSTVHDDFGERTHFEKLMSDPSLAGQIPSFHKSLVGQSASGRLVCYRGLVYDMYDPEYYTASYVDKTGRRRLGKYRDAIPADAWDPDAECLDEDMGEVMERLAILCTGVPGESQWLRDQLPSPLPVRMEEESVAEPTASRKRQLGDDIAVEADVGSSSTKRAVSFAAATTGDVKSPTAGGVRVSPGYETLDNCALVRIYSDTDELRLNDMVEFICVYTSDPLLDGGLCAVEEEEEDAELMGPRYPPASVAPRLHCILFRKLESYFPLYTRISTSQQFGGVLSAVGVSVPEGGSLVQTPYVNGRFSAIVGALAEGPSSSTADERLAVVSSREEMTAARNLLLSLLTSAVGGDSLAAEYVLLTVLGRLQREASDSVLVGMVALQLVGLSAGQVSEVRRVLHLVAPRVVKISGESAALNATCYQMSRDYATNSMSPSPMRLAAGTVLLVDATREPLLPTALSSVGKQSVRVVRGLIAEQKLAVSCGYSDVVLRTDAPAVVFSGATAVGHFGDDSELITVHCQPSGVSSHGGVTEEQLQRLRLWWATARLIDTKMGEAVQSVAENDFVTGRQSSASVAGPDAAPALNGVDFHRWVGVVRLIAASHGEAEISLSHWQHMRSLEAARSARRADAAAAAAREVPFSPSSVACM